MQYAKGLVDFINESWTPFHAVSECKRRLEAAGEQSLIVTLAFVRAG